MNVWFWFRLKEKRLYRRKEKVKINTKTKHLLDTVFVSLIAFCLAFSLRFISIEATMTLLIFNFLYGILIFQLNGTRNRKFILLLIGNLVGLFWNFVFQLFAKSGTNYFGSSFDGVYTIIFPFLNLLWLVPCWSLSLGFLPKIEICRKVIVCFLCF